MANGNKSSRIPEQATRRAQCLVLVAGSLLFGYVFTSCSKPENKVEFTRTEPPPSINQEFTDVPVIDPNKDFSNFDHKNPTHSRFPCALCHERKDNSATPKLSGHTPCSGCHTAQFADNKSAICTICHKEPETGVVRNFPRLKSFNVVFNHARHLRQANCATCHKPSGSAAFSIPSGLNAHNTCFQCHSPGSKSGEQAIDSCSTCHREGKFGGSVSHMASAFTKTPFRHANHRLDCAVCHSVKAGSDRGNQVTAPLAAMHRAPVGTQSCASCHNNKRAFGGDDFSDCTRCHRGPTYKFS